MLTMRDVMARKVAAERLRAVLCNTGSYSRALLLYQILGKPARLQKAAASRLDEYISARVPQNTRNQVACE